VKKTAWFFRFIVENLPRFLTKFRGKHVAGFSPQRISIIENSVLKLKGATMKTKWLNLSLLALAFVPFTSTFAFTEERLSPTTSLDIVDTLSQAGEFEYFSEIIESAGLRETLKAAGPVTVLAPTDEAFRKLAASDLQMLMTDKEAMGRLVWGHVISGKFAADEAVRLGSLSALGGEKLLVTRDTRGDVHIRGIALVVVPDLQTSNGIIHAIDSVLMFQAKAVQSEKVQEQTDIRQQDQPLIKQQIDQRQQEEMKLQQEKLVQEQRQQEEMKLLEQKQQADIKQQEVPVRQEQLPAQQEPVKQLPQQQEAMPSQQAAR